jgi:hypothetical protein
VARPGRAGALRAGAGGRLRAGRLRARPLAAVRLGQPGRHPAWVALLGLVVLGLLAALPHVGGPIAFLATLLGTGAFALALVRGCRGRAPAALGVEPLPVRPVEVLRESA